jgi:hypothetical protein
MNEKLFYLKAPPKNDQWSPHGVGALTVAPAILQAKDQGRQFIVAVSDPAFPFAADAELQKKEGSAKVFDRRKQLYEGVLGEMGAAERRGEQQTISKSEPKQKRPTTSAKTRPRPDRS